jgi:choline dehydrogenase
MMENFGVEVAFGVFPGLQRPESRGRIHVESTDPSAAPRIELNFFDTEADKRRMREGMRIAWDVVNSPAVLEHAENILLLDQATVDDDDALDKYVWDTAIQIFHPVGTAKMGPADDPQAVVDQFGRVHGVDGLRVVDASIMPNIPRANTNLTCIMIGEHIADSILNE